MKNILPSIGISHTTQKIEDLYRQKLSGKTVIFHPAAQPNSYPHLGTLTSLISTFSLAKHLTETIDTTPRVLFWELENAPGEIKMIAGRPYFRTLGTCPDPDFSSKSERHLSEFRRLLAIFSRISGVPYKTWNYQKFQKLPTVRNIILEILENESILAPLLCPSEVRFKVRFFCPKCHFSDKAGGILNDIDSQGARKYNCVCPIHGSYFGLLSKHNTHLFDVNTPVRALAREVYYIQKMKKYFGQNIMCDGADWVQYAPINMEALLLLGIPLEDQPARFFAPMVVDHYGAKLAKSTQIAGCEYKNLPLYNVDSRFLETTFGEEIYEKLWNEISGWQKDPRKIFRNYTVSYFQKILGK